MRTSSNSPSAIMATLARWASGALLLLMATLVLAQSGVLSADIGGSKGLPVRISLSSVHVRQSGSFSPSFPVWPASFDSLDLFITVLALVNMLLVLCLGEMFKALRARLKVFIYTAAAAVVSPRSFWLVWWGALSLSTCWAEVCCCLAAAIYLFCALVIFELHRCELSCTSQRAYGTNGSAKVLAVGDGDLEVLTGGSVRSDDAHSLKTCPVPVVSAPAPVGEVCTSGPSNALIANTCVDDKGAAGTTPAADSDIASSVKSVKLKEKQKRQKQRKQAAKATAGDTAADLPPPSSAQSKVAPTASADGWTTVQHHRRRHAGKTTLTMLTTPSASTPTSTNACPQTARHKAAVLAITKTKAVISPVQHSRRPAAITPAQASTHLSYLGAAAHAPKKAWVNPPTSAIPPTSTPDTPLSSTAEAVQASQQDHVTSFPPSHHHSTSHPISTPDPISTVDPSPTPDPISTADPISTPHPIPTPDTISTPLSPTCTSSTPQAHTNASTPPPPLSHPTSDTPHRPAPADTTDESHTQAHVRSSTPTHPPSTPSATPPQPAKASSSAVINTAGSTTAQISLDKDGWQIPVNLLDVAVPLVQDREPLANLMHGWDPEDTTTKNLTTLITGSHKLSTLRRVRGDGNCGYRAFLAGMVEAAFLNNTTRVNLLKKMRRLNKKFRNWSFPNQAIPHFYQELSSGCTELLALIANEESLSLDQLLEVCRQQGPSDSMLLFLRAVTAAGLLAHKEVLYDTQIQLGYSAADNMPDIRGMLITDFCTRYVLPLVDQADESTSAMRQMDDVHLHSLAVTLGLTVQVHDLRWSVPRLHEHVGSGSHLPDVMLLRHGMHFDVVGS